jgi:hypothetical protein
VPYYQQTDFVLSLVLSDPLTEEKLPAVVVRSGLREYLSWLALPFAFFTLSESDLEDQLTYELTRAALDEATRQGIVKVE